MALKVLPAPKVSSWSVSEIAGGLNTQDLEYKLRDNQSPDCKNVWFNNRILCKRWGTMPLNTASVGSPILAMYDKFFLGNIIFAAGTGLYKMDPGTGIATQIYSGLTANKGVFFRYSVTNATILWYLNGAQYVQYDGTTVSTITPYIPTVVINRGPTGGGNDHSSDASIEDYNRLGAGFKNSFSADGTAKAYTLTEQNLDSTAVTATVAGTEKHEGTDFTVNRTTGVVTFSTAPVHGDNNVIITAYKTHSDWYSSIVTCTKAANFGGPNNNRLFFAGNGSSYYYYSDVGKAHYWPINQYNFINTADDSITGFGLQNDTMLIFKGNSIYGMTYKTDSQGVGQFPVVNVNSGVGCDCPGTIQLINNKLTWLTSGLGPMTLVNQLNTSGSEVVYRNVNAIGRNINGNSARSGLLNEPNLENAVAVDFQQKYWIAVNGHVYLWDYGLSPYVNSQQVDEAQSQLSWWYFENLDIQCFCQNGTDLYFGDSQGFICHFENNFVDNRYTLIGTGAQSIANGNFATDSNGDELADSFTLSNATAVSCANNTQTLIATAQYGALKSSSFTPGHRYFVTMSVKSFSGQVVLQVRINAYSVVSIQYHPGDGEYHTLCGIVDTESGYNAYASLVDGGVSDWQNISAQNAMAIDMGTDASNPFYNLTADDMAELVGIVGYRESQIALSRPVTDAISAYWKMKTNHLGAPNILKNITKIWFACRSNVATTLQITYFTDNRPDGIADNQPITVGGLWDLNNWDLGTWFLGGSAWFGMWRKTPPMNNVEAFSMEFRNGVANEDLNISDIIVSFTAVKEVRRSV